MRAMAGYDSLNVGNKGTGKTLLGNIFLTNALLKGKWSFSTGHNFLKLTPRGKPFLSTTPLTAQQISRGFREVHWIPDLGEFMKYTYEVNSELPEGSAFLLIEEGYLGFDSRTSLTKANVFCCNWLRQSRHFGFECNLNGISAKSFDLRVREVAPLRFMAKKFLRIDKVTRKMVMDETGLGEKYDFFYLYKIPGTDLFDNFTIPWEVARPYFSVYQTQEHIFPPKINMEGMAKLYQKEIEAIRQRPPDSVESTFAGIPGFEKRKPVELPLKEPPEGRIK